MLGDACEPKAQAEYDGMESVFRSQVAEESFGIGFRRLFADLQSR